MSDPFNQFAWAFASEYLQSSHENSCISPYGVYLPLTAIAQGAAGKTKEEFEHLLANSDEESICVMETLYKQIKLGQKGCQTLNMALELKSPELSPKYKTSVREHLPFVTFNTSNRPHIDVTSNITFEDRWEERLENTSMEFYPDCGKSKNVPALHGKQDVNYIGNIQYQSAAIQFSSPFYMVFAMPKKTQLDDVLQSPEELSLILNLQPKMRQSSNFQHQTPSHRPFGLLSQNGLSDRNNNPDIYFPRFTIKNCQHDISPVLKKLGIRHAFGRFAADFSEMGENIENILSVEQEVEVKVTADGAYAKAVTSFRIARTIGMEPIRLRSEELKFDHPFVFAIFRNELPQSPIFVGTFQKP